MIYIAEKLKPIKLPPVYIRDNKQCYLDPYRKRLIKITPEETVRQKILTFYETEMNVPRDMFLVEVPMAYYTDGISKRADIIIHEPVDALWMKPFAVIECKNEDVPLTDNVVEQVIEYCGYVRATYIIITNGIEIEIAKYNESTDQYEWLNKLLSYAEMMNFEGEIVSETKKRERLSLQQLTDNNLLQKYNEDNLHWIFGTDTPLEYRGFITNLYECLMDQEHQLPITKTPVFELLQDLGVRYMDYTNAGGGHYEGYFRSFLVKDLDGDTQIISVSLFGTDSDFRGENRRSYTSLVIAIDNGDVSHNILQYNVDRFLDSNVCAYIFNHNGQISGRKSQDLKKLLWCFNVGWLDEKGKIVLGLLSKRRLFYLDGNEEKTTIYSMIEYALLREKFKRIKD